MPFRLPLIRLIAPAVVLAWLIAAVLGPAAAPYDPAAIQNADLYSGVSSAFLLGTDYLGRDMLSRIVAGARHTVGIALVATALAEFTGLMQIGRAHV